MIWRRSQHGAPLNDSDLPGRAQQGDTEAFATLVRHYEDQI